MLVGEGSNITNSACGGRVATLQTLPVGDHNWDHNSHYPEVSPGGVTVVVE